ncbi:hypothetical protein JCM17478_25220 [Thermopirellula anaerolimosa]
MGRSGGRFLSIIGLRRRADNNANNRASRGFIRRSRFPVFDEANKPKPTSLRETIFSFPVAFVMYFRHGFPGTLRQACAEGARRGRPGDSALREPDETTARRRPP